MDQSMQPENKYEEFLRKEKIKHLKLLNQTILDVGGGSGNVWDGLVPIWSRIDLVEPDLNLAAIASTKPDIYKSISIKYPDNAVFLPIDKYDTVCILGVLEHVDDPVELLLNYDGANRLYITVPNADSFHRYVGMQLGIIERLDELGPQDYAIGHKRVYDVNSLKKDIKEFIAKSNFEYKYIKQYTTSLKFGTSSDMETFTMAQVDAINKVSDNIGISNGGIYGAEIVAIIEREK